jgi:superfamily II DNA/RNA helicase
MTNSKKTQENILQKLSIESLNAMQVEAQTAIENNSEVVLLSPTGTGKTLAFMLPIIAGLNPDVAGVQVVILVPSRELAIQIEQVVRNMGTGYKVNAAYGGRAMAKDRDELKHEPTILIGTPGRIADHVRRETVALANVRFLVLDEFDKSLEVGFEPEMKEILRALPPLEKTILTSATQEVNVPPFVGLRKPTVVDYLKEGIAKLQIKIVVSPTKDKLETLVKTLNHLGNQPGIVFCNFRETILRVSEYLTENNIPHGCFYGDMEQHDRERALIKFRNGSHQLIVATDLAARGLDIPEIKFIIHYHLPQRSQEFTHRNGRTARMKSDGTAYVLKWVMEDLPEFIPQVANEKIKDAPAPTPTDWVTLFINGGRRDKISKGDVAGLFLKQAKLSQEDVGVIELKHDCAFVAIKKDKAEAAIQLLDNTKLKSKKVRITAI